MIRIHDSDTHGCVGHGNVERLGQCARLRAGLGECGPVAHQYHRAFCAQEFVQSPPDRFRRRPGAYVYPFPPQCRVWNFCFRHFPENVVRNIEIDRPRTAREHGCKSLPHHQRQHFRTDCLKAAFDVGADGRRKIRLIVVMHLLKRPPAELVGCHVAGDGKEG